MHTIGHAYRALNFFRHRKKTNFLFHKKLIINNKRATCFGLHGPPKRKPIIVWRVGPAGEHRYLPLVYAEKKNTVSIGFLRRLLRDRDREKSII